MSAMHVIVRAAAERTADLCCEELVRQSDAASVDRVEFTPFWKTLREGLQRGFDSGAEWIFSIDADIIPARDAIARAVDVMKKADDNAGVITCLIQDKLLGGLRYGGVRLYRGKALPVMLECMPPKGEDVRPETATINRAAEKGWVEQRYPALMGIHDYQQFYRDIYRKAFLHMQKHGYMAATIIPGWMEKSKSDDDFRVALGGVGDALYETSAADCDASHAIYKPELALERLGLTEKESLVFDYAEYDREVRRWQDAVDSGSSVPAAPEDEDAYARLLPGSEVSGRIENIGTHLRGLAATSPLALDAALHEARRALPDDALLGTFGLGELIRHFVRRVGKKVSR